MLSPSKSSAKLSPSRSPHHSGDPSPEIHGDSYTYRQLRQRAESVGAWLQSSGLQPSARCAILAGNKSILGRGLSGYSRRRTHCRSVDTAFTREQVGKLLDDCGASLIFADAKYLPVARQASTRHELKVALIDDPDAPNGAPVRHCCRRQRRRPAQAGEIRTGAAAPTNSSPPRSNPMMLRPSSTPREPPAIPRASCSPTAT